MNVNDITVIFRLIAKISDTKSQNRIKMLIVFYFISIEKKDFDDFAEKLSKNIELNEYYTLAWSIGVMNENYQDKEVQKLVVFLRNHCDRNELPLIDWLKIQRKVLISRKVLPTLPSKDRQVFRI